MKPNVSGIVGAIMAFISVALPWWTITIDNSPVVYGGSSYSISIYTYQTTTITDVGLSIHLGISIWYAWVALVLIVLGGLLGIVGSLVQNARRMVAAGGLFALLSTIIFAAGLQIELSRSPVFSDVSVGSTRVGLFSSGIFSTGGIHYTTYLFFGFWLALVGALIMLAASLPPLKQSASPPTPTPPSSNPPQPSST